MEVSVGPDGAIYGLDWSDTGECHDHTGVHRTSGRIYKFFYNKNPVADPLGGKMDLKMLKQSFGIPMPGISVSSYRTYQ